MDWEFRIQIGKFGGEVDQSFHGRQAQVASLRGWVLVQRHSRSSHISDVDPPRVDGVQLKLLAWYKFAPSENYLYLYHVFFLKGLYHVFIMGVFSSHKISKLSITSITSPITSKH